jgi:hypothetical protein
MHGLILMVDDGCTKPGGKPICFLLGIVSVICAVQAGAGGKSRPVVFDTAGRGA